MQYCPNAWSDWLNVFGSFVSHEIQDQRAQCILGECGPLNLCLTPPGAVVYPINALSDWEQCLNCDCFTAAVIPSVNHKKTTNAQFILSIVSSMHQVGNAWGDPTLKFRSPALTNVGFRACVRTKGIHRLLLMTFLVNQEDSFHRKHIHWSLGTVILHILLSLSDLTSGKSQYPK